MKPNENSKKSSLSRRLTPPESITKTYGDGLVNRAVAAEILGISVSELRRRERDKIYPFIVDEKGSRWYDENMLRQAVGRPPVEKSLKAKDRPVRVANLGRLYTKEEAARVFRELDAGASLSKIVQEQSIHPETAIAIQEVYARTVGGMIVTGPTLEKLGKLPLRGQWPPKSGEELASVIEASMSPIICRHCQSKPARFCSSCAGQSSSNGGATYGAGNPVDAYGKPQT